MVKQGGTLKGVRTAIQIPTFVQNLLNQAAAVQNTWYPIPPLTLRNVLILGCNFAVTGVNETLEVEYTIDGVVYLRTQAAVALTDYPNGFVASYAGVYMDAANPFYVGRVGIFCKTFSFRMRKTTATGAAALRHSLNYQQW